MKIMDRIKIVPNIKYFQKADLKSFFYILTLMLGSKVKKGWVVIGIGNSLRCFCL